VTQPARFRLARYKTAPAWLTTGEGELVGYALDVVKDAFVERLRLGLMARLPYNDPNGATTAPADALAAMGRDRKVVRGINESDASYAGRLLAWLDDRKTAGNPFALMQKLAEYTGPGPMFRTVDNRGNWYTRAVDGERSFLLDQGNWDWDGDTDRWSRFWVIIYPNGLWTEGLAWGDVGAVWGEEEQTWGSTATAEQVQTIRSLVADWKPAGTRCKNIIIAFDNADFDPEGFAGSLPDGLWGRWAKKTGGLYVTARNPDARYWDGV
jgi:hypothetical protein